MDCSMQASLSITKFWSLLKLMSIESVMPSKHLNLCVPLLLLPSIFPSIRVFFQWVSSSHQVARVLECELQHQSFFFSPFIFISWKLITLQYCSGFCHTLAWISHGFTCVPHPDPASHLPLHPIPLGFPSAPALSTCLIHPTWAGDLFHPW